jgi:hypothetical protein
MLYLNSVYGEDNYEKTRLLLINTNFDINIKIKEEDLHAKSIFKKWRA